MIKWGQSFVFSLSDMFNVMHCYAVSRQGIAFQLIFLASRRLPRTSAEPRRVIGIYSGIFHSCYVNCVPRSPCYNPTRSQTHKSLTVPATQCQQVPYDRGLQWLQGHSCSIQMRQELNWSLRSCKDGGRAPAKSESNKSSVTEIKRNGKT